MGTVVGTVAGTAAVVGTAVGTVAAVGAVGTAVGIVAVVGTVDIVVAAAAAAVVHITDARVVPSVRQKLQDQIPVGSLSPRMKTGMSWKAELGPGQVLGMIEEESYPLLGELLVARRGERTKEGKK